MAEKLYGYIKLKSEGGAGCTERVPPKFNKKKSEVDIIQFKNINSPGGGNIDVWIEDSVAQGWIDPLPGKKTLAPGETCEWIIVAPGKGNYHTRPAGCRSDDRIDDILIDD